MRVVEDVSDGMILYQCVGWYHPRIVYISSHGYHDEEIMLMTPSRVVVVALLFRRNSLLVSGTVSARPLFGDTGVHCALQTLCDEGRGWIPLTRTVRVTPI